jgi:hypothetical protein
MDFQLAIMNFELSLMTPHWFFRSFQETSRCLKVDSPLNSSINHSRPLQIHSTSTSTSKPHCHLKLQSILHRSPITCHPDFNSLSPKSPPTPLPHLQNLKQITFDQLLPPPIATTKPKRHVHLNLHLIKSHAASNKLRSLTKINTKIFEYPTIVSLPFKKHTASSPKLHQSLSVECVEGTDNSQFASLLRDF